MATFDLITNWIYLFHTDEYILLPQFPDSISDQMGSTFAQQNVLSRTAPVYSFSYSGPRTVQVDLDLHRDMLNDVNINGGSNIPVEIDDDYVDTIIKKIQSIALPAYDTTMKAVTPPMVAVKLGKDVFIKGVVIGGVSVEYQKPILSNDKYAKCTLHFNVYETTPYDAKSVAQLGSFRGITRQFKEYL